MWAVTIKCYPLVIERQAERPPYLHRRSPCPYPQFLRSGLNGTFGSDRATQTAPLPFLWHYYFGHDGFSDPHN